MNKELTKELNLLQEKFNKEIEDVKKKYEKPMFEVGKWYKETNTEAIYRLAEFNGIGKKCNTYGFNYKGEWMNPDSNRVFKNYDYMVLASPQEVESALTKWFNKIFTKNDKAICLISGEKVILNKGTFTFDIFNNRGYYNGICIFKDGIWALPIKEKTLDELALELGGKIVYERKQYLTENKQEVINILNNL